MIIINVVRPPSIGRDKFVPLSNTYISVIVEHYHEGKLHSNDVNFN